MPMAALVQLLHGSVVLQALLLHGSNLVKAVAEDQHHGRTVAAMKVDTITAEAMVVQLVLQRHGPTEVVEEAQAAVRLLGNSHKVSKLHGSNNSRLHGNSSLVAMMLYHLHLLRIFHRHHHRATFHLLHHRLSSRYQGLEMQGRRDGTVAI